MSLLFAFLCTLLPIASADEGADTVEEAVRLIQTQLPNQPEDELLYRAALAGITGYLNQQAGTSIHDVLTEAEHDRIEAWQRGERDGIGAIYQILSGRGVLLEEVFSDGPAARSGMATGDLIVAIDDQPFTGLSDALIYELTSQAAQRPRITLDVVRSGQELHRFEVLRGRYQIAAVSRAADQDCTIDLLFFGQGSAARLASMLPELPEGSGLLLDLRDNQGGLLSEALEAASLFLESGAVITYRRTAGGADEALVATGERQWSGPVVVLINERTTGAAEVFASALQAHRAATLVGTASAGQAAEPGYYPVGSGLVLKLADTTLRAPSGRSWAGTGLTPDVQVNPLQQQLSLSTPGIPPDIQRDTGIQLISCP